jgi:hypothetical protein
MSYAPSAVAGSTFTFPVSGTQTTVRGVSNLAFSGGEKPDIEVTGIDDTTQQFVGGRRQAEELSGTMAYDPSNTVHAAMRANYVASGSPVVAMTLVSADAGAASRAFSGYIKLWNETFDAQGALSVNFTIKLTTGITLTP